MRAFIWLLNSYKGIIVLQFTGSCSTITSESRIRCYVDLTDSGTLWRHEMEAFSALLALCEGNRPVTGRFPSQRASNADLWCSFDVRLNKVLNKQSNGWWIETPWCSLWRHHNGWIRAIRYHHRYCRAINTTGFLCESTNRERDTHICVSKPGHHWFR